MAFVGNAFTIDGDNYTIKISVLLQMLCVKNPRCY